MLFFKKIWIKIKSLFKKKKIEIQKTEETVIQDSNIQRIAIIIGHSEKSGGASLYNGSNEYKYNKEIAETLLEVCKYGAYNDKDFNKVVKIFNRNYKTRLDVGNEVGEWNADLSLELHFNAAKRRAKGCEMLILKRDRKTAKIAQHLIDEISSVFSMGKRHDNGIKYLDSADRGYTNLMHCRTHGVKYPMIVEPFFGNYETRESKKFVNNKFEYVNVLYNFIKNA